MNAVTIFTIGVIAGFVCFGIITMLYLLAIILEEKYSNEDFEDLRTPETFQLPTILHEIDTTEQETIYNN